jgi:hypothetical protein
MNETGPYQFVKVGNIYYPADAIQFEVNPLSVTVTIYKLGTHEVIRWIDGPQAHLLITNLNNHSLPLLYT